MKTKKFGGDEENTPIVKRQTGRASATAASRKRLGNDNSRQENALQSELLGLIKESIAFQLNTIGGAGTYSLL